MTHHEASVDVCHAVFPARAGMNRVSHFDLTRDDESTVFPARAGMNRESLGCIVWYWVECVPRAGGDEPVDEDDAIRLAS